MEFTLDTVNVEYRSVDLVPYHNYRDRRRMVLRFYFYTDYFTTMGTLAKLKRSPDFLDFIKGHIHTAIITMSEDMFEQAKLHINSCHLIEHHRTYGQANKHNVLRLRYTNSYKFEDCPVIAYEDSLDGWNHPIETREDLIRALLRVTSQSISK